MDETAIALAKTCVETVDAELDVKPEIQVFGKACHQQRNVGYYSDVSMHYNYSTNPSLTGVSVHRIGLAPRPALGVGRSLGRPT